MHALKTFGWLLRHPGEVAARCREDRNTDELIGRFLAAIAVGCGAYGSVLGSFRGGVQVAYAAVKLPLAVMAALAFALPAIAALTAAIVRPWPLRSVAALTLAAAARTSLLLLAFAPYLWLLIDLDASYHTAILGAALGFATASGYGLGVLFRGLGASWSSAVALAGIGLVFLSALAQTSWISRPYLVRPQTVDVPFVRPLEGGFVEAIATSFQSRRGRYTRDHAPVKSCRGFRCD